MEKSKRVSEEDGIVLFTQNNTENNLNEMINQKLYETDQRSEMSKDSKKNYIQTKHLAKIMK